MSAATRDGNALLAATLVALLLGTALVAPAQGQYGLVDKAKEAAGGAAEDVGEVVGGPTPAPQPPPDPEPVDLPGIIESVQEVVEKAPMSPLPKQPVYPKLPPVPVQVPLPMIQVPQVQVPSPQLPALPALPVPPSTPGGDPGPDEEDIVRVHHDTPEERTDRYAQLTPTDLDDSATHRARFTLDRNWALTGATLEAVSLTLPETGIIALSWHFDQDNMANGPDEAQVISRMTRGAHGLDAIRFRPLTPGVHHLTLTVAWAHDGQIVRDRVTTPIYVEDPAIQQVHAMGETATWTQASGGPLPALPSLPTPASLQDTVLGTVSGLTQAAARPTVLVIGDFIGPAAPSMGLAVPPGRSAAEAALRAAIPAGTPGFVPEEGLGDIAFAGPLTGLGAQVDFVGRTVTRSLQGVADVVFVSAIDPVTGGLNRPALQNGLLYAKFSGRVDAVVWALPAATYQPALVTNSLRPDFNFAQTPMLPLPAPGPLPAASPDWRKATHVSHDGRVLSVMDALNEQATLLDLPPSATGNVADVLAQHMDRVYPRYRVLVETVRSDLAFDALLRDLVGDLNLLGVPVVVPSDTCAGYLSGQPMTVVGLGHVVGTITVADGGDSGPSPDACQGPDRRAASHGNGVDFVADPRPFLPGPGTTELPYVPNSIGAAAKVAAALGALRLGALTAATPYSARDLAGMLASRSSFEEGFPAWAQGTGYVAAPPAAVPSLFARGTGLTFTPFDLRTGRSVTVADVVVTGLANVQQAMLAPPSAWTATGRTEYRLTTDAQGGKILQDLATTDFGHLEVHVLAVNVTMLRPDLATARLTLAARPALVAPSTGVGVPGQGPQSMPVNASSPREWLLPGLYSGRTWISTPTGIVQLPINIGVGTIYDVYRFLAPNTPVSDTAVCLQPPFMMVGELTGLRHTAMELEDLHLCVYFANTDDEGVARFYTPLPLPYTLTSWFNGIFHERGDGLASNEQRIGAVYPHAKRTVFIPAPLNVDGIGAYAGQVATGNTGVGVSPGSGVSPPVVTADLPYPLAYVPLRTSIAVAIGVNWRYRDNMETDHFLPEPGLNLPEALRLMAGGLLPRPVWTRTGSGLAMARQNGEGLLRYGREHIAAVVDPLQAQAAQRVPLSSTTLDAVLSQPVSQAVPASLAPDPAACQFGYGHHRSPALTQPLQDAIATPGHTSWATPQAIQEARTHLDDEAWWPDTLTMRARPTLDSLLGLTTVAPICAAVYPFNIPQPNTYPTHITNEFVVHLEAALLVVCAETVADIDCYLLTPGPAGTGNVLLAVHPEELVMDLPGTAGGALSQGMSRLQAVIANPPQANPLPLNVSDPIGSLPVTPVALPDYGLLQADGRVALDFTLNAGGGDHGFLHYVAIPLPLLASGHLDPLVGLLVSRGIDPRAMLNVSAPTPLDPAVANAGALLRSSVEDLMRVQPYIEIREASMGLNAWWWDDSFFDVRIFPSVLLPRSTTTDCARSWQDTITPPAPGVPRWPADPLDPTCLRDASGNVLVRSGTSETPNGDPNDFVNGDMNLGEDFWWLTHPNVNQELFRRGTGLWDPHTLQPDPARIATSEYPWAQPEFFENVLEFWDDEEVVDITPNELHIHSPVNHNHHQVQYTKHCTDVERRSPVNGGVLNDPATGQFCFEALLAYNEGDGWMENANTASGIGVYDLDRTVDPVRAITLHLVDQAGNAASNVHESVWATTISTPLFSTTPSEAAVWAAGIDPAELQWWDRGETPTGNRAVYSDLYTNSSFMLSRHDKACEEIADFTTDTAMLDLFPRWRTSCPWEGSPGAQAAFDTEWGMTGGQPRFPYGFVPDDPNAPRDAQGNLVGHWDWSFRVPERGGIHPFTAQTHPRMPVANAYQDLLNPLFLNGTFRKAEAAFGACRGGAGQASGWGCQAQDPMGQALLDLAEADQAGSQPFRDPVSGALVTNPLRYALWFFGLDNATSGGEAYATVPLPSNPDGWFGDDPDATEWNGFYRNLRLRQLDTNTSIAGPQDTDMARMQDQMTALAPLLRAWLEGDHATMAAWYANPPAALGIGGLPANGPAALASATGPNPFWEPVHGQPVPYAELVRPRPSSDPEAPLCAGLFWAGQCHAQSVDLDTGDLSPYGRNGIAGRMDKPKTTYIPQGSTIGRWNREHLEPVNQTFLLADAVATGTAVATGCGLYDGRDFHALAPASIDMAIDGWAPSGAPAGGAAAPAGFAWYAQQGRACTELPWEAWARHADFRSPAATPQLQAADAIRTYYERDGILLRDPNDPLGLAVRHRTTYDYPDPANPTHGVETGCWADPTLVHSPLPHMEISDPFDVEFQGRHHAASGHLYRHEEPDNEEPGPAVQVGDWCDQMGQPDRKDRMEREYIPLRLPRAMNGGDPDRTLLPPVTTFHRGPGPFADVVGLGVGSHLLPKIARAVLADAGAIADGILPNVQLNLTQHLPQLPVLVSVPQQAQDLVDAVQANAPAPLVAAPSGGSPLVPFARLAIAPDVQVAELAVGHLYAFPAGTQGVFAVSTDMGATWTTVAARGAPGFAGSVPERHVAFLDLTPYVGQTVVVATQILGAAWPAAAWTILDATPLAAGAGPLPQGATDPGTAAYDLVYTGQPGGLAQMQALSGGPGNRRVLLQAPLTVPAGVEVTLEHVEIVVDASVPCGMAPCPIVVQGNLTLRHGGIRPLSGGGPVYVQGHLHLQDCDLGGLAAGIEVLGGRLTIHRCWLVGTGPLAVLSVLGRVEVTESVVSGQSVGVYALQSEVRLEGNLFTDQVRAAVILDESWGAVRDNVLLHTKQAGIVLRGPHGGANYAVLGNRIEETGSAILVSHALEDRVGALDPWAMDVPVAMRTRVQGNTVEWATLEAVQAGTLSAPVLYGNSLRHSNIGVLAMPLDAATVRHNDLYASQTGWAEAAVRTTPPQDGNLWAGLWQAAGSTLPIDATGNHWGPAGPEVGTPWPNSLVLHNQGVDFSAPTATAPLAPYAAALTAPGYGGGAVAAAAGPAGNATNATVERPVPVQLDVAPGVTSVTVRGTFYASGLASLAQALPNVPTLPPGPTVARVETPPAIAVPAGATHVRFTFAFASVGEAYADWEVVAYADGTGSHAAPFADHVTKDVRVHNSLAAPALGLTLLVRGFAHSTLDGALAAVPVQSPLAAVPTAPGPLAASGLPLRPLPDGTIAIAGHPSLAALPHDQDPVRLHEARARFADLGPDAPYQTLGQGLAMERFAPLPAVAEGRTLEVQARAIDASGLAGPWSTVRILADSQAPTVTLGTTCAGAQPAIVYTAEDALGSTAGSAATADGLRPSGVGQVRLRAVALDALGQALSPPRVYTTVVEAAEGNPYTGTWVLPAEASQGAAAYEVTAAAVDRAGHAGTATGIVLMDLQPPAIAMGEGAAALSAGGLLPPGATVQLLPVVTDGGGCGVATVDVEAAADGVWQTLLHVDVPPGQPEVTVPPVAVDLDAYDGSFLQLRVRATDHGGAEAAWTSPTVLVDRTEPGAGAIATLPPCGSATVTVAWGAHDLPAWAGGTASGLASATLAVVGPDGAQEVPGAVVPGSTFFVAEHAWEALPGPYTSAVTVADRAGHQVTVPGPSFLVLPTVACDPPTLVESALEDLGIEAPPEVEEALEALPPEAQLLVLEVLAVPAAMASLL